MQNKDIVQKIKKAIEMLKHEARPLQASVHERSFAHRLAVHMEQLFKGWDIDCEYNKHGLLQKKLDGIKACDGQRKTDRIFPDIIVHERTNDSPVEVNLLAIELKHNDACDECDQLKLKLLTKQDGDFKYKLGLYININVLEFDRSWYRDGQFVEEAELLAE